jgi:hypothetical protein
MLGKLMKRMMKMAMKPLDLLDNKIVSAAVKIFLVLYAGAVAPQLPRSLAKLMKNNLVKMVVLFLIIYTGMKDTTIALMGAVAFVVTMMALNRLETVRNIDDIVQGAVDIPQELLNKTVDGGQELVSDAGNLVGRPVSDVVGVANQVVDTVQDAANKVVDMAQGMVPKLSGKKENFSMKDRDMKTKVPDMGSLNGLSGYSPKNVAKPIA